MFNPVAAGTYNLGSSIGSTDTSILLSSFADPITGVLYTMTILETSIAFGTIAPKTSSSEFISFTGITQNANGTATLTGVTRGLGRYAPYTPSSSYQLPHSGQSIFILSDMPQVFNEYVAAGNAETITGLFTFTTSPVVPTGGTGTQAANNQDIANAITGASGTATNTNFGTVKLSVAAVSTPNPIVVGDNDSRVPTANETAALVGNDTTIAIGTGNKVVTQTGLQNQSENYGVTTGSANAYILALSPVPTAYKAGQTIRFTTNFANTGSATINVNSLGAKTLQLNGSALTSGQLANGATYQATYDGANFQISSPVSGSSGYSITKVGVANIPTSASTQTIAHGLGTTPKSVQINATKGTDASGNPGGVLSFGAYNGSTTATVGQTYNTGSGAFSYNFAPFTNTTSIIYLQTASDPLGCQATIAVDATNITLTWTAIGTYSTANNGKFNWIGIA